MLILSCFHNNFYSAFKRLSNLNIQIHVASRFRQLNASVYRENYWACLNKIFRASPICILQSLISKYRYDFSNNIVDVVYFLVLPLDLSIIHITNYLSIRSFISSILLPDRVAKIFLHLFKILVAANFCVSFLMSIACLS